MKKDTLIVFCSADLNRLVTRRSLGSIKATDLERAELHIFDNNFDRGFSHPIIMEKMLRMAEKRRMNVVYLDDDVEIHRFDWLERLYEVGEDMDADIVSCVQSFDNGRINSIGELVDEKCITHALTDFRHDKKSVKNRAVYVPTLCSAIMLVKNPHFYHMDGNFRKYKQDLDICMQAWDTGRQVAVALDMDLIHNRGLTGEQNPSFLATLQVDVGYFANKWKHRYQAIRKLPQLAQYAKARKSWTDFYNDATNNIGANRARAIKAFREVVENCYIPRWVAGAHFHLFKLTCEVENLKACNRINPCHAAARDKLAELGQTPTRSCELTNDCRTCNMRRFGYVMNDVKDLLEGALRGV